MALTPLSDRLFVSIAPPEPCREALSELMEPIEGVRWVRPEQLHLTLRFVGDVVEDQSQRLVTALQTVKVEPFLLPLEGVGMFPERGHPRVLWAGLGQAHTRLFQLRQRVDDALLAAGWTGELRSFEPHITVGRVTGGDRGALAAWVHRHRAFEGPPFRVSSFELMASDLHSSGAVHRIHTAFPLGRETALWREKSAGPHLKR